jgi:PAT family beta-lactamase induction signal transducer AmpG
MNSLLKAFGNRRIAAVLLMGFSSGIPLALTGATLQAWMANEKVDLTVIGLFSLVAWPYTIKFLWSPLMDRFVPPFLGRRRGWIAVCQILLIIGIIALGFSSPSRAPVATAIIAVLVTFFSASQDVVIDAYRTDLLENDEIAPGASVYILGYRVAMLVSGGVALILADHMSWRMVYVTMAAIMAFGLIGTFLSPDPRVPAAAPASIKKAVIEPFFEFFKRKGAVEVLAFILFYKLDAVIAFAMMTPFMLSLGFTNTDIGAVSKGFGLIATLAGTLIGGGAAIRLGLQRSLWIFGLAQGISGACFMMLAHLGHHYPMMVTAIAAENFFTGMGTAVFAAFIMSICDKRYTATQYALLSSLFAITRVVGGAPTGWMAKTLGWETFYLVSILAMIPGLLLLTRYKRWQQPEELLA